jgi:hypothetical protein
MNAARSTWWHGSRPPRPRSGQALAEFALVAPVIFLLLFSVIQVGLTFGAQNGFVNGVRETARRASTYRVNEATFVDPALTASICTAIDAELTRQLAASMPGFGGDARLSRVITYRWTGNPDGGATYFLSVDIDATYLHQLYVPLVAWFFDRADATPDDGNLTMTAREQMRIENPPQPPPGATEKACP